jgi:malate dehydrogenase (oxaloacetate-decarboxylating)(NADP+)
MLLAMADNPVVFAMANPVPEIDYHLAKATRTDYYGYWEIRLS